MGGDPSGKDLRVSPPEYPQARIVGWFEEKGATIPPPETKRKEGKQKKESNYEMRRATRQLRAKQEIKKQKTKK
jgi:hypothetical protein